MGHDQRKLVGDVLHAVGAERVLGAYLPAGLGHISAHVAVVGRVKLDLALQLARAHHAKQLRLEPAQVPHGDPVAAAGIVGRGHIVAHDHIFLVEQAAAAAEDAHRGRQQKGNDSSAHGIT